MKAKWKSSTAKETLPKKSIALLRRLAKVVSKVVIKAYGCPKLCIIHFRIIETVQNKEQVAKREGPIVAKIMPEDQMKCEIFRTR
jgi:hypothetical protein